jgi:Flp pilus assembly pilin Flp
MFLYVVTKITNALHDRKGVTSLEYGVLAVAIIGALGAASTTLHDQIVTMFTNLTSDLPASAK